MFVEHMTAILAGALFAASNQIFLAVDAGTPVAACTARRELKAYLVSVT